MRTIIISALILIVIALQSNAILRASSNISIEEKSKQVVDLKNIQNKIQTDFMNSFIDQNNTKITERIDQLSIAYKTTKNALYQYWKGYALYHNCIIYLKKSDRKSAEKELDKAIEVVEGIQKKNSEDYALLSMLQSFSCQFTGFPAVIKRSKDATTNIDRAIEMDKNNLRAYYVYANNDYYTPENYGGGKNVEEYALKALSLPSQKIKNIYLPSWGKQEAYELLTNYYLRTKNILKAEEYIAKGLKAYPDSYILKANKSKISK